MNCSPIIWNGIIGQTAGIGGGKIPIVRHFKLHIAFSTQSRVECRINPADIDFASNFAMCLVWAVLVLRQSCRSGLCTDVVAFTKGLRVVIIFTRGKSVLGHYDVEMLTRTFSEQQQWLEDVRQLQRLPAAALQCGERTRGHNCRSRIMRKNLFSRTM